MRRLSPPPLPFLVPALTRPPAPFPLSLTRPQPLGHYKKYTQIEGPFDAVLSWGATGQDVKDGWRSILQSAGGAETLAARSWFGYLGASGGSSAVPLRSLTSSHSSAFSFDDGSG